MRLQTADLHNKSPRSPRSTEEALPSPWWLQLHSICQDLCNRQLHFPCQILPATVFVVGILLMQGDSTVIITNAFGSSVNAP